MQPHYKYLTEEENRRNSVQPMEIYEYTSNNLGMLVLIKINSFYLFDSTYSR